MKAVLAENDRQSAIEKADDVQKTEFEAEVSRGVSMVYKVDDDFYIWGPASVEVVDKENDKIRVEALEKALPQLLKRSRLSYAHTDQLVGRILERFETAEPVEVTIGDDTFERSEFPTDVLELDDADAPALYVAGEVYDDTEQANNVREKIEEGEVDSYSISGEALVTRKQVEGDMVYDDILELDLSAVTLCEEGMNQDAKFAQIDGEVQEIETADAGGDEKSFELQDGRVRSPDAAIAKSDSDSMTEEAEEKSGEEETPKLPENAATKSFVKEQIQDQFEEQFKKHFNVHFSDRGSEMVKEQVEEAVSGTLPEGDLATKTFLESYIDKRIEAALDDLETKEESVEVEGDADVEVEEEEEEEEETEEEPPVEEEGEGEYSDKDLKENLPSDVYEVVSEYLGTTKEGPSEEVEETEKTEKSVAEQQEDALSQHVEQVLAGDGPSTPSVGVDDQQEQFEKQYDEEEGEEIEGGETSGSPALENFDHA